MGKREQEGVSDVVGGLGIDEVHKEREDPDRHKEDHKKTREKYELKDLRNRIRSIAQEPGIEAKGNKQ